MKIRLKFIFILGLISVVVGIFILLKLKNFGGWISLIFGFSLIYLGWKGDKTSLIIFGHISVINGCILITWGIYLLPYSKPIFSHVFTRPLFWGLFSLMGGLCAIYHGFCRCIKR